MSSSPPTTETLNNIHVRKGVRRRWSRTQARPFWPPPPPRPRPWQGRGEQQSDRGGRVIKGFFARLKSTAVDDEHPRANDHNPPSSPLSRHRRQMEWQSRSPCCTRPSPQTPNRYISVFTALASSEPTTPTPVDSSSNRVYLFPPIVHRSECQPVYFRTTGQCAKNVNRSNFPRQNGSIIGINILPNTSVYTWTLCSSTWHYIPHTRSLVHKYREADDDYKVHLYLIWVNIK